MHRQRQRTDFLAQRAWRRLLIFALVVSCVCAESLRADDLFNERVVPIIQRRCLSCHNERDKKGSLSLETRAAAFEGGDSGAVIEPQDPDSSTLLDVITPENGKAQMPKGADALSADDRAVLRRWIVEGAKWPEGFRIPEAKVSDTDWWSLKPLARPAVPDVAAAREWAQTPIDQFIAAQLVEKQLSWSPEADRQTLLRRLSFDLTGLPPTIEEVEAFASDTDPNAYEKQVDRLLASPRYGERWARHWLDVVHYGDTQGYDKDKLRLQAWPYRDYVIRSLNADKPYSQFINEQVAGDMLYPDTADGIVALGFIAAGPWDFISHVEVPESKTDGKIARSLDRDDMVRTVMETVCSMTVGCARCHNHKFDPILQEDYYALQAVFAAIDRANRPFDADPAVGTQRRELARQLEGLKKDQQVLETEVRKLAGAALTDIDKRLAELLKKAVTAPKPEFGYHSQIESRQDAVKWVQLDLGETRAISQVTFVACHDDFNNIGAGFGFPVRFKIEVSTDEKFENNIRVILDQTGDDVPNPGVEPQSVTCDAVQARYVRFTATKLAPRQNDYILALAEMSVYDASHINLATGAKITSLDSIEAPVRWQRVNLVDGYYYGVSSSDEVKAEQSRLSAERQAIYRKALSSDKQARLKSLEREIAALEANLTKLPPPQYVFAAATDFPTSGNFVATKGQPREIRLLRRGSVLDPGEIVAPGTLSVIEGLPARFGDVALRPEGARRAALAEWLTSDKNPLTWRSIVNRVWQHHFGRGLVDSPNDFGRMGQRPSHPALLDYLAAEFRDGNQSLKALHRQICLSAAYRQSSATNVEYERIDADNISLWRMNRRRLEAEAIRDTVLAVSGKLDLSMYGPGFQDFVIEHPEHSPHFEYTKYDPEDVSTHRRSIYRFVVRSQQQPFMTTLDCADPSMQVDKRNETVTPLQALALLNNKLMLSMSKHFAARAQSAGTPRDRARQAIRLALSREPAADELTAVEQYVTKHGLAATCRLLFNLNEFVFVD